MFSAQLVSKRTGLYKSYFRVTQQKSWFSRVPHLLSPLWCFGSQLVLSASRLTCFHVFRLWRMKKVWVRFCRRWALRAVRTSPSRTSGNWSTNRPFRRSAPCTKRRTSSAPASCSKNTWDNLHQHHTWTPGHPDQSQTGKHAQKQEKKSFTDQLYNPQSIIIYVWRTKADLMGNFN